MANIRNPRSVACPRCRAVAGEPCRRTARGNHHHGARIAAARAAESHVDLERKLRVARDLYRP
jgi:hypothetical protein